MSSGLGVLLRKEFLELRADRKALLLSVFLPVFLYPGILVFTSSMEKKGEESQDKMSSRVLVQGEFAELHDVLQGDDDWEIVENNGVASYENSLPVDEFENGSPLPDNHGYENALSIGELDLVVVVDHNFVSNGEPSQATLRLMYHRTKERSRRALSRIREILDELEEVESARRQRDAGAEELLDDLYVREELDIATEEESSGAEAGGQIIYLLLMTLFISSSTLASDLVAGEKERGTLETLYLVPRPRDEIAMSKVLVVVIGTSLSGVLALGSIAACFAAGLADGSGAISSFSISSLLAASALVLPLAALLSGILLAISTYARNLKESQQLVMPAMLICFGAGLLTYSQALELSPAVALIPVVNVALAMRDVLAGQLDLSLIALTSLASLGWAALVLRWVGKRLRREEMVLGFDPEPFLARTPSGQRRATMLALSFTVLAYFYLGSLLQTKLQTKGLLLSLWVLLPLLGALSLRLVRPAASLREVLSLRLPRPAAWPAAILLSVGSLLPMMGGWMPLQERFLPSPSGGLAELEAFFAGLSLLQLFVLGALSPGICEEFVFRGVFLGLLRRVDGARSAAITTALFFGLIHLNVFRFVPTAALGLILAYLVIRSGSIFPSMLFHVVYNGSLLLGAQWVAEHGAPFDLQGPLAWALSALALCGGFVLLRGAGSRE